ncbi:hypothetical protein DIPPA_21738 [Diplonema papillatum]|nr:hypothetical protein DIPPA_21738 [Diplonema papillatum]
MALTKASGSTGVWPDARDVVRLWGEDPDKAPKFKVLNIFGMQVPKDGDEVWTVATCMFMFKQQLLAMEVEAVDSPGSQQTSHKLVVIKPGSIVQNGQDWIIPSAEAVQWDGNDVPKSSQDSTQRAVSMSQS